MTKEQMQKLLDFAAERDFVIMYNLRNDDYCGLIEVSVGYINLNDNDIPGYVSKSDHPRAQVYDYLEDCDFDDFVLLKKGEKNGT